MTANQDVGWSIEGYGLHLGPWLRVSVQRTTQTPTGSLPPKSYGALPLAADPGATDVLVPVRDDEAVWLGLEPLDEDVVVAVRVEVAADGRRDAVTGRAWLDQLTDDPQNYVVCPPQRALDGITMASGRARQFARRAATSGAAATARLRVVAIPGSAAVAAGPPLPVPLLHGRRHPSPPARAIPGRDRGEDRRPGVGQIIAPDPFGLHHWRPDEATTVTLRLVSPAVFTATTGLAAPAVLDPRDTYDGRRLP